MVPTVLKRMCDFSHCYDDLAEDDICFVSFMTTVFLFAGCRREQG